MRPAGGQIGSALVVLVLAAVFVPPAIAALKAAVAPLLVLAVMAGALRLLWYWTSL